MLGQGQQTTDPDEVCFGWMRDAAVSIGAQALTVSPNPREPTPPPPCPRHSLLRACFPLIRGLASKDVLE